MKTPIRKIMASPTSGLTRRTLIRSAFVTAGAVTLGGVGGCARGGKSPGGGITLTQWYHQYGEEGTRDAVLRYAADYTKANPGINIEVVWVPGDYVTKLNTALLVAGGPDVFERNGLTVPMVSAGQVAALDDLFPPNVRADFDPADLEAVSVDGKIYAAKMVTDTQFLYYRPSMLKKAGVAPPRTLDELIDASKALVAPRRKGTFLGNDGGVGSCLYPALWSAGQQVLRDGQVAFDNPRSGRAFERLRVLTESDANLIGAPIDWWDPSVFNQGLAAIQWGGLWSYPAIKKELGEDIGVLPWPALDAQGRPAVVSGGWWQMVNSRSPHLEEAKKYVNYLWIENEKVQRDWNLSYGFHVPPRTSVAQAAKALKDPAPAQVVENLRQYGYLLPPAWSGGMGTALSDAAINIVKLGRPASAQIEVAAAKCKRELERQFRFR